MTILAVRALSKRFGSTVAVDGLDVDLTPGAITGFLGSNGAGKTTILRMILGLVQPTSGTATFNGQPYHRLARPASVVGALIALVLGVFGGAGEHRHGTLTPTLLVTPARGRVMAAKALVHAVAGAALGVGTALFCLAVTAVGLSLRGAEFALSTGEVVAAVAGAGGYVGLATVFSLGVGAALANQAAAITAIFTLVLVVENVLVTVAPSVARWMPGQTGSALGFPDLDRGASTPSVLGADVLPQALGGVAFAGYALIAVLAGAVALRYRDIT